MARISAAVITVATAGARSIATGLPEAIVTYCFSMSSSNSSSNNEDLADAVEKGTDSRRARTRNFTVTVSIEQFVGAAYPGKNSRLYYPQWVKQHIKKSNRSEEHTSELQSRPHLVCRLLLE